MTTDLGQLFAELQGNILRAYGSAFVCVRHLVLAVKDPQAARTALGSMLTGDRSTPEITPAKYRPRTANFGWCLNVGITFEGLKALGVPKSSLATFPREFREGMVPRATRLGDVGPSDPSNWSHGLRDPDRVHLIVTIHGRQRPDIEPVSEQVLSCERSRAFELLSDPLDGEMLKGPDGTSRFVHFGYLDGLAQPRFEGIHDLGQPVSRLPFAPLGTVLLGHPTALPHVMWRVPEPDQLGRNGSFTAFRVLRQHVRQFEDFLQATSARLREDGSVPECTPDLVAAKLCGRWRNGAPLTRAPTEEKSKSLPFAEYNNFDYPDDPDGTRCPIGSHIRRCNPRGAQIVQRAANRTRPLVRRGIPYGPPFDPEQPDDGEPRGLLGNFLCASLAAQFEAMQYDWINLGLQHPAITGTNDPLIGHNDGVNSTFVWPREEGPPVVLKELHEFVTTEGGAYCFLPSLPALGWLASAAWA